MEAKRVSAMEFGTPEFTRPEFTFEDLTVVIRRVKDAQKDADIPTLSCIFKVSETETAFGELVDTINPKTGTQLTKSQLMKLFPMGTELIGTFDVYPKTAALDKVTGKQLQTRGADPQLVWNRRVVLKKLDERIMPETVLVEGLDDLLSEIEPEAETAKTPALPAGVVLLPE
jgi:hypothetical protein